MGLSASVLGPGREQGRLNQACEGAARGAKGAVREQRGAVRERGGAVREHKGEHRSLF